MANNWHFIDPEKANPYYFGLTKLFAVKVKKHDYDCDVRTIALNGWITIADLLDVCPITGKNLNKSEWFIFAAKGEESLI